MAQYPYILRLGQVVALNSFATLLHPVPPQEKLWISEMRFISTGIFNITSIRDSSGRQYTNASAAQALNNTLMQSALNAFWGIQKFEIPLELVGGTTFYIDLAETSGAGNTIVFAFACIRETN